MEIINDHNVYILGAGFSVPAGLPQISDFLLKMRDSHNWLNSKERQQEARAIEKVLQFRLNAASASYWVTLDLENIEELFSLASASAGSISEDIRLAIAATLDYARDAMGSLQSTLHIRQSKTFNPSPKRHPDWIKPHPGYKAPIDTGVIPVDGYFQINRYAFFLARLLGMFQNGIPKGQNSFITFNYDTLLEEALTELNLAVSYGPQLQYPRTPFEPKSQPVPVLKLHGSVNWARPDISKKEIEVFDNYKALIQKTLIPELVPPTWKKVFEHQLESIWEEAIKKLNTATRVIIIGFSMPTTDLHFKYLLAAGLQNNVSLRQILFVNPARDSQLEQRARELLRSAYVDSHRISFSTTDLSAFTNFVGITGTGLHGLGRPAEDGASYQLL